VLFSKQLKNPIKIIKKIYWRMKLEENKLKKKKKISSKLG
jgi:hypothetical protein